MSGTFGAQLGEESEGEGSGCERSEDGGSGGGRSRGGGSGGL